MRQKVSGLLTFEQAMENLSRLSSINMESPPPIGLLGEAQIVVGEEAANADDVLWLGAVGPESLENALDITYHSIFQYLKNIAEKGDWKREREGISALMALVGESAHKVDAYFAFRFDQNSCKIEKRRSFKELQEYYILEFSEFIEGKGGWTATRPEGSDLELRDFEALMKDKEYELFFISDERGEPYLSEKLLRNVKLTADFDLATQSFEDDPFMQVKGMQDRDLQATASQILDAASEEISLFYEMKKRVLGFCLAKLLSKAVMALYLAANSRHLAQRTMGKTCTRYFHDFQVFLREAIHSPEYQKWIVYHPEEKEKLLLLGLVQRLCYCYVTRECGIKQEAIGLIHRTERKGGELQFPEDKRKATSTWNQLLLEDEKLRTLLASFPGGPLLKTLDVIRHEEDEWGLIPFDPWIQGNTPCKQYSIKNKKKHVDILSFGAPIRQAKISNVEINEEFRGFLRCLATEKKCHLLINLQDRLSWQEGARCNKLEKLQKTSSFSKSLRVITLPKHTDFYHQRNGFKDLDVAEEFIASYVDQIENGSESGFFFPASWKQTDLLLFTKKTLQTIHESVFAKEEFLTRQMRQDFIELFYQLLILEAIDHFSADSVSFTCKDGIDTGAYATTLFYAFLKGYAGDLETSESLDTLRYLFYWRAMSIRERAPDPEQFFRALSCIELWHRSMEEGGSILAKNIPIDWVA